MQENPTALVTGASRGIGRAIALKLASMNIRVAINYTQNEEAAKEVLEEVEALGSTGLTIQADVSNENQVNRMMEQIREELGPIGILVNNAGITRDGLLMRMKTQDWHQVIDTNLTSAFYTSRAASRDMMRAKAGRIIHMASVVGLYGNAGQTNYSAAKAGLIGLTRSMAKEFAAKQITVNAVAPGFIQTEMTESLPESVMDALMDRIPMKQLGTPEDIAETVGFLIGPGGRYITGQVLQVDGGIEL